MSAEFADLCWIDLAGRPLVARVNARRDGGGERAIEVSSREVAPGGSEKERRLLLRADRDAVFRSPWTDSVEIVMCDLIEVGGEPSPLCSRDVLRRVLADVEAIGAQAVVAAEFEFSLYHEATEEPAYRGIEGYGIVPGVEFGSFLRELHDLRGAGIPVESCHLEYGAGQFEINLRHTGAGRAMDEAVLLRTTVAEVAKRHDLRATFMAKPWTEHAGNGMHLHHSLWGGGRNLFFDEASAGLSPAGRAYLGGLLRGLRELSPLGSPTSNSYRRREARSFCPVNASWGVDNRTVAVRALTVSESATRLEQRDAAADCNPYLALAGQLTAGLEGMRGEDEPPPPIEGNAYGADVPPLPRTLESALAAFANSDLALRTLGPELFGALIVTFEREAERSLTSVGEWERRAYLTRV
ncbi:MAG: glutamine synthetase family protein [Solirubrobacteraceae bacterium]